MRFEGFGNHIGMSVLALALFTSLMMTGTGFSQVVNNPDQQIETAVKLATDGNAGAALLQIQQTMKPLKQDTYFCVRALTSLNTIADHANENSLKVKILNEAISLANSVEKRQACDGRGNAEIAWHYMTAVGMLAEQIESRSEKTAGQLYLAAGKVAANLKQNSAFPKESVELLAGPIMGKARHFAIAGEQQAAFQAIEESFATGFNDFESLRHDRSLAKLDQEKFAALIEPNLKKYQAKVDAWAESEIASFATRDFKFDVEDIEAGRMSDDDFSGSIVVVDLWATWCPPCREGIPHFVKLADEFAGSDVEVVGISMDSPHDPDSSIDQVREFADESHVNYCIGMGTSDISRQLSPEQKLPTTLFLDRTGKVRYIAEGFHNFHQLKALTGKLLDKSNKATVKVSAQ